MKITTEKKGMKVITAKQLLKKKFKEPEMPLSICREGIAELASGLTWLNSKVRNAEKRKMIESKIELLNTAAYWLYTIQS